MGNKNKTTESEPQVFIGFHTKPELKEAIARLAQRDGRSLSKYTERLLMAVEEIKAEMEEPAGA